LSYDRLNALEHEADIAKVQEWLGHANIATTRLYDRRKIQMRRWPQLTRDQLAQFVNGYRWFDVSDEPNGAGVSPLGIWLRRACCYPFVTDSLSGDMYENWISWLDKPAATP
jgi:hypothetical protein